MEVGIISRAHGVKGEVKVQLITDEPKKRLGTTGRRCELQSHCLKRGPPQDGAPAVSSNCCLSNTFSTGLSHTLVVSVIVPLPCCATSSPAPPIADAQRCLCCHVVVAQHRLWLQASSARGVSSSSSSSSSSQLLQRVTVQWGRLVRPESKDRREEWAVKFREVPDRDKVGPEAVHKALCGISRSVAAAASSKRQLSCMCSYACGCCTCTQHWPATCVHQLA